MPMCSFQPIVLGNTLGAHNAFIEQLEAVGLVKEAQSHCDYYLVFCPVISRLGTDISEAMRKIPGDKQVILVVMHHTFNPDTVVLSSSRLVSRRDIILTVDCLFYEGSLLDCRFNQIALRQVKSVVSKDTTVSSFWSLFCDYLKKPRVKITLFILGVSFVIYTYYCITSKSHETPKTWGSHKPLQ